MKFTYLGKKALATVPFTPFVVWEGHGDVQEVTDPDAVSRLRRHPNTFRPVSEEAAGNISQAPKQPIREPRVETPLESDKPPLVNLDHMGEGELREFAQRQFNHEFHHNAKAAGMRNTIVSLMNRG